MPQQIATTPCLDCSFRSLIFDTLTENELGLLDKSKEELIFKKGENIITEGQQIEKFVYLRKGLVKLSKRTIDNKEHIVSLARTKTFFGFLTVFSQDKYQYTITALTDSSFCLIDIQLIKEIIRKNGDFALDVLSKVTHVSDEIIYNRLNISAKQLRGRIAYFLILLSKEIYHNTRFVLPLTRREIGELIDMSTANVIRMLSEFRKDGIIETNEHTIKIHDFQALEKISRYG